MVAQMTPEQLQALDHYTLLTARKYASPEQQGLLSPYEHQAYAREYTYDNPQMAPLMALMTLGYQPAKALGLTNSRSGASMGQMKQGLKGVYEGLSKRLQEVYDSLHFTDPFPPSI